MTKKKALVIIKHIKIFDKWYIGHAQSGQSAFSSKVNGFDTEQEAMDFAFKNNCEVLV